MAKKTTKTAAKTPARARALSIHIGLNAVSPAHYEGWSGELAACEFDARDMAAIAKTAGMKPTILLTKNATRNKVLTAIRAAAKQLKAGDFLFGEDDKPPIPPPEPPPRFVSAPPATQGRE